MLLITGDAEENLNHREAVGTSNRICQELPRCNWLEEKILKKSAVSNTPPTAVNREQE